MTNHNSGLFLFSEGKPALQTYSINHPFSYVNVVDENLCLCSILTNYNYSTWRFNVIQKGKDIPNSVSSRIASVVVYPNQIFNLLPDIWTSSPFNS